MSFKQYLDQQVAKCTELFNGYCIIIFWLLVGGSDYQEISAEALDALLTFDSTNHQQSLNVAIIDDSFFELDVEDFMLKLRFDPFESPPASNVMLHPNVSTINILDNDGKIHSNTDSDDYVKIMQRL